MPDIFPATNDLTAKLELAPPRGPLPEPFLRAHAWDLAAGVCLAVCLVGLWIRFGRRKQPAAMVPPGTEARRELETLRGRKPEIGLVIQTSRIVRRFLVRQMGLPPAELTTAELCRAGRSQQNISPDAANLAADFLTRCDTIKFAPDIKSPERDFISEALQIVEQFEAAGNTPNGSSALRS